MVHAAVEALPDTRVTAVTLLTSLDRASARELGISGSPSDIVARWAATAVDAGARALERARSAPRIDAGASARRRIGSLGRRAAHHGRARPTSSSNCHRRRM